MQPSDTTAQAIQHLIHWCEEHEAGRAPEKLLPWNWFACQRGLAQPLWIEIARHLFRYPHDQVGTILTHAHQLTVGARIAPFQRASEGFEQAYTPEDVLRHAASANGWGDPSQCLDPQCLSDRLLHAALSANPKAADFGPAVLGELSLTQMLVHQPSRHHQGLLLALNLQAVDSSPHPRDLSSDPAGQLFPAPAAALLQTDEYFNSGLAVVNDLLKHVLKPGAPAIAWSFDSLALPGDSVKAFAHIEGPSASAALAYGALYLLRHHLDTTQPHVARLAEHLRTIETPHTISTTAALVPSHDPAQPWPLLDKVDGVPEKLAALASSLPLGRTVSHRFVAAKQKEVATVPLEAEGARNIGYLVEKIAQANTSLDADARLLHAALQQDRNTLSDAAIAADPALQAAMIRLRSRAMPGYGVRAHLVWRYAQLCTGQLSPFGDVVRLGQHFVSLSVEGPSGHGLEDERSELEEGAHASKRKSKADRVCTRLKDILYPTEPEQQTRWQAVPSWCIQAQPFSGKSTLIQHWELTRIRDALSEQAHGQGWGEVPVFLPMNTFMRHSGLSHPSAEELGRALRDYAKLLAPALPWSELLPEHQPTPAQLNTPRPDGLRVRLCIDALNEYRTGQANEGSAIGRLCDWLAPRCDHYWPGALLPPIFSVRREEAANFQLTAKTQKGWQAHTIILHPWCPSQMRAYVIQRDLPQAIQTRILQALQLPCREADHDALIEADRLGPANELAKFSQLPGFLSAQCTLLERWPDLPVSGRRAQIMLALAWHGLDKWQNSSSFDDLQRRAANDPALASLLEWLLPSDTREQLQYMSQGHNLILEWEPGLAGGLLAGLGRVADAMQDPKGGEPEESALWRSNNGHTGLRDVLVAEWPEVFGGDMPEQWFAQAAATGLVLKTLQQEHPKSRALPWLRFTHQQIQEFFSALNITPEHLPDLTPPSFDVSTAELDAHLRKEGSKLELPAVTPHTERLRFAADLTSIKGAERLIETVLDGGNLALAAQLAIDQRARLESPADDSGRIVSMGHWFKNCQHPLLQHLRARLLIASVDTGANSRSKLHNSGVLRGIAETVEDLPLRWRSQWLPLLPALRDPDSPLPNHGFSFPGFAAHLSSGLDLRQRLNYGLLLGELGDNLRFERISIDTTNNGIPSPRIGICLKSNHWIPISSEHKALSRYFGRTKFKMKDFCFFAFPTTTAEWLAFQEDPHNKENPLTEPMIEQRNRNSLHPITGINWYQALEFIKWVSPLYMEKVPNKEGVEISLPTEAEHQAASLSEKSDHLELLYVKNSLENQKKGHKLSLSHDNYIADSFNHQYTGLGTPSPIGVFSRSITSQGIDIFGNAWTWCSTSQPKIYEGKFLEKCHTPISTDEAIAHKRVRIVIKGGSYKGLAENVSPAYRGACKPEHSASNIGLRIVLKTKSSSR